MRYLRILGVVVIVCVGALTTSITRAEVTLEKCLDAARENYPLISEYNLIKNTEEISLSDINKGWLPRIGVYAQASMQNVVPSFPSALSNVMQQMGGEVRGLGKFQYKAGIDLNQTIWDGGMSKSQREIEKNRTIADRASLEVELYSIRQRVESLYFGILLINSQIEQTESAIRVYESNLERLRSMLKNGTAMQSDVDMIEAQLLTLQQQLASANSAEKGYRSMLSLFTHINLEDENLAMPNAEIPKDITLTARPEINMFESQRNLNNSRRNGIDATIMPKIGFFAQAYYGYPGIDYFKAMMSRDLSFNVLAGVKLSWNVDALYTKKNSLRKIDIANEEIEARRNTFLLNTELQSTGQLQEIRGIEDVMKDDARIVALRGNVRKAAESQLRNGVIDATALTTKINDETQAQLTAAFHKIQLLQAIYNLKNTLNQ